MTIIFQRSTNSDVNHAFKTIIMWNNQIISTVQKSSAKHCTALTAHQIFVQLTSEELQNLKGEEKRHARAKLYC